MSKPVSLQEWSLNRLGYTGRSGGVGHTMEQDEPRQTYVVRTLLPRAASEARHEMAAGRRVEYHREPKPYGERNGRAICPACYDENRPGSFEPETGRCLPGAKRKGCVS